MFRLAEVISIGEEAEIGDFLKRYFIEQHEIPYGTVRWRHFGWQHFVWLCIMVMLAVALTIAVRKSDKKGKRAFELWTGIIIMALDVVRTVFLILKGQYDVGYLPLHLCGMSVYIEGICAIKPRTLFREFMWSVSMPGALMAMMIPDWTMYEPFVFYPSICFLLHILLVVYPFMLVAGGIYRPDCRNLWKCLLFLAVVAVPIYFINKLWNTNFMFINWAPAGTPLAWAERLLGTPGYILSIPVMLVAVWAALYIPFAIRKESKE